MRSQLIEVIQIGYWLALSAWFGSVLFVAAAAQGVFKTIKENKPVLPHVLAVNLEDQHATLLAGAVVGNLLSLLAKLEIICAALLLVTIGGQWILLDKQTGANVVLAALRTAMYIAATVIAFYDSRILWPKIWKSRQKFIDNADEPDTANPALEEFDRYQRESTLLLLILLGLLLGMVLFSGSIGFSISNAPVSPS